MLWRQYRPQAVNPEHSQVGEGDNSGEVVFADRHLHHQLLHVVSLRVQDAEEAGHESAGMEERPRRLDHLHLLQLTPLQNIFKAGPHITASHPVGVLVVEEIEVNEDAAGQMEAPVFSNPSELCAGLADGEEVPPVEEGEHVEEERLGEGKKLHDDVDAFSAEVSQ